MLGNQYYYYVSILAVNVYLHVHDDKPCMNHYYHLYRNFLRFHGFFCLFVLSNSGQQQLDTRMREVAVSALLVEGDTLVVAEGGKRKGKKGRKERERK